MAIARQTLSIAMLAAMSPRNFARMFSQAVGKTPGKHIEDLRIEVARHQLDARSSSLSEVARASGFNSAEVMRRAFMRHRGITPGCYRKSFGSPTR